MNTSDRAAPAALKLALLALAVGAVLCSGALLLWISSGPPGAAASPPVACPSVIVPVGELDGEEGYAWCTSPGTPCRRYLERCKAIGDMDAHALLECQREQSPGAGPLDPPPDDDPDASAWTEGDVRQLETGDYQ